MPIDPVEPDVSSQFAVVVHDVTLGDQRPLGRIFAAFGPLVGDRLIAAVVPCWHGVELGSATVTVTARAAKTSGSRGSGPPAARSSSTVSRSSSPDQG